MPGVPGKGCNSCRKSKKKCDQKQPICSRCERLTLLCEGSGRRRLKFQDETVRMRVTMPYHSQQIVRTPQNASTSSANRLIAALQVTDLRYDLSTFGGLLREIPARVGRNETLDAAVDALNCSYSALRLGSTTTEMYAKYGKALRSMRSSILSSTDLVDTLCAIYLIVVCEGWMRIWNPSGAHGKAMAHLLQAAGDYEWEGCFEQELVATACTSVIMESLSTKQIMLGSWFIKILGQVSKSGLLNDTISLQHIARVPEFIFQPELHLAEMETQYIIAHSDMKKLRPSLAKLSDRFNELANGSRERDHAMKNLAQLQGRFGVLLTIASLINRLLSPFRPFDEGLRFDATGLRKEALELADAAAPFRPLGASYMPLLLVCLWAAAENDTAQSQVERALIDFESDYTGLHWKPMAAWMERRFEKAGTRALSLSMIGLGVDA